MNFSVASRKGILKVVKAIIESITWQEIFNQAAEQITHNLEVERCTIYRIFNKDGQYWCEIVAGVPVKEHGIGLKEELVKHPDIQAAVDSQENKIINDPEVNFLTSHFREIILDKRINQILYIPASKEIVAVVDATKEKKCFSSEEIEFCSDVGQILALVFNRIQTDLQEWRHLAINPISVIGGYAKRIVEAARRLDEEAHKLEQIIPEKL